MNRGLVAAPITKMTNAKLILKKIIKKRQIMNLKQ